MAENKKTKDVLVVVEAGNCVDVGKTQYLEGKSFSIAENELPRLLKLKAVRLAEEDSGDRIERLAAVCGELDENKENLEQWTKSGVPQVAMLEILSGLESVTAAERNQAYKLFLEQQIGEP